MIDCPECGHSFDPAESPSFEVCRSCVEFLEQFYGAPPPVFSAEEGEPGEP